MKRIDLVSVIAVGVLALGVVSCGGSDRELVSIAVSPSPATAKNGTVQLTATGTFSSAPITVTPLSVQWTASPCDNLCNAVPTVIGPVGVNQAGLATCPSGFSGSAAIYAIASKNPNVAPGTSGFPVVSGETTVTCP